MKNAIIPKQPSIFVMRISFLVVMLFLYLNVIGQSTPKPLDALVTVTGNQGTFYVELDDTIDVSMIEIGIGDLPGSDSLFNREYVFDQTTNLPSGISYLRNGSKVWMGFENISLPVTFFSRV